MSADKDQAWELVQIKGLTAWANTYLDAKGAALKNLETDFHSGVNICLLTEALKERIEEIRYKKIGPWTRKPAHRMQKIENCNIAINFLKSDIKVRLTVGAEDLVGDQETNLGNKKMILGMLWATFRRAIGCEENSNISEEHAALLEWVRTITAGYKGVDIKGMKDSWGDGMAFNAMLHKAGVKFDYSALNPANGAANLEHAFRVAEEQFKIPQLLEIDDLINNTPDDRSVAFYLNLLKHAMADAFEKNKTKGTLEELQSRLQAEEEMRRMQEEELAKSKQVNEELQQKLLLEELLRMDETALLEEKIDVLTSLLDDEELSSAARARLQARLEEAQRARQELEDLKKKLAGTNSDLLSQLEEAEKRRAAMLAELDELRKRVAKQVEKSKRRGRAAVELEGELEDMKRQAIVQQRARFGLDVLKRNLEEHLEDMYKWREINSSDDDVVKQVFDLQDYLGKLKGKTFEAQLDLLNASLQNENQTLKRLLQLKEDVLDMNDTFIKSGWLEVKDSGKIKEWKKLYFNLRGSKLSYHKSDATDRSIGGAVLEHAIIHSPDSVDGKDNAVKIELKEPKGFVITLAASSADDAAAWYAALSGERLYARYLSALDASKRRADTRISNLCRAQKVNSIYVDNKDLGTEELHVIAHSLAFHPTVDTVSVSNAGLTDDLTKELADRFAKSKFRTLILSENKFGDAGAAAVADAGAKNKYLSTLDVSKNAIGADGAKALLGLASLTALDLSGNGSLGDAGAAAFAAVVGAESSKIKKVQLAGCGIGDEGAAALANMLKTNKGITHVDLSNNKLTSAGAKALAAVVGDALSLSELDLSGNQIDNAGAVALQAAAVDAQLHSINLSDNKLVGGADLAALLGEGFKVSKVVISK